MTSRRIPLMLSWRGCTPRIFRTLVNGDLWDIDFVLIQAYIFADRFVVPEFAKAVSRTLFNSCTKDVVSVKTLIIAFKKLPSESPILRLLVDTHWLKWYSANDDEDYGEEEVPAEFYHRLARRFADPRDEEMEELNYADYEEPEVECQESKE
ncbi:hypothetical protein NX059_008947 [Plenodomus lindquistii]|nr:hypothetical protein NX059_008947 [Plenodomus lindquistii]